MDYASWKAPLRFSFGRWRGVLLLLVPAAFTLKLAGGHPLLTFAAAALALVPLASLLGDSTEQVAAHVGSAAGGLLLLSAASRVTRGRGIVHARVFNCRGEGIGRGELLHALRFRPRRYPFPLRSFTPAIGMLLVPGPVAGLALPRRKTLHVLAQRPTDQR